MAVTVIQSAADSLPLADASVDLIVTSPPYFALRKYTDGGKAIDGQLGSEATPAEYIKRLTGCTREWMRVLKPEGSLFVNMGDKYSQRVAIRSSSHQDGLFPHRPELHKEWRRDHAAGLTRMPRENIIDGNGNYVREKSLLGLPWRYAIACTDELGLILRAEIIWSKPNGLPESVRDRVRRSHEQVFHFTKQAKYFAAVDEIREPHVTKNPAQGGLTGGKYAELRQTGAAAKGGIESLNPLGKLPGSVWTIATSPLVVPPELGIDHFAAFPPKLVLPIVLGWSPRGICAECGESRRPVAQQTTVNAGGARDRATLGHITATGTADGRTGARKAVRSSITGYACGCQMPVAATRPAVVLDPMGGTGTTALVASVLGRDAVTADLSADYCRLAVWRTSDPKQQARVSKAYAERQAA